MPRKNDRLVSCYPNEELYLALKSYAKREKVSLSETLIGFAKQGLGLNQESEYVTKEEVLKLIKQELAKLAGQNF